MLPKTTTVPFLLSASIFLCDQATKFWVEKFGLTLTIIPGLLRLAPLYNPGFFFGLFYTQYIKVLTFLISFLVFFVTVNLLKKETQEGLFLPIGTGLIWGGMLGNLTDRVLCGMVFDFIQLWRIPTFNLADLSLTFGTLIVGLKILSGFANKNKDGVK